MSKYCVIRIIGNENTPRDKPGSRLKALEFILKHEPKFPDTEKLFVLNKLIDLDYQANVERLLTAYKTRYGVAEMPWEAMKDIARMSDNDVNLHAIGINQARNSLIDFAHKTSDYAVLLDGDCIFTKQGWDEFTATVDKHPSKYYSIPMVRIKPTDYFKTVERKYEEPLLAFRKDAEMRFDPGIPFGKQEKLELLYRLGHDKEMDKGHCQITGDLTRLAGYVCHLSTGIESVESDQMDRLIAREISLHKLYLQVRYRVADLVKAG